MLTAKQKNALAQVRIGAHEIIDKMELVLSVTFEYRSARMEKPGNINNFDLAPDEVVVTMKHEQHNAYHNIRVTAESIGTLEALQAMCTLLEETFLEAHEGEEWDQDFAVRMWERLETAAKIDTGADLNPFGLDMAVVMGFKDPPPPGKFHTGGYIGGGNTGNAPDTQLVKACPALDDVVRWPRDSKIGRADPIRRDKLRTIIINLNDREKWTRERVADWIDTLDLDTRVDMEKL